MRGLRAIFATIMLATPAAATLDDDPARGFRGLCQMTQTCTAEGRCGATPAVGTLLVLVEDAGTWMGRDEESLEAIDHYASLQDALPLPPLNVRRRTFLTNLPADGAMRRFAMRIQTLVPQTGEPVLRGQYFVLTCDAQ